MRSINSYFKKFSFPTVSETLKLVNKRAVLFHRSGGESNRPVLITSKLTNQNLRKALSTFVGVLRHVKTQRGLFACKALYYSIVFLNNSYSMTVTIAVFKKYSFSTCPFS